MLGQSHAVLTFGTVCQRIFKQRAGLCKELVFLPVTELSAEHASLFSSSGSLDHRAVLLLFPGSSSRPDIDLDVCADLICG